MLITKDFVFIHLPKTGGDFIRTVYGQNMPEESIIPTDLAKHAADHLVPAEYRDLPRFGLIRNPWAWYVSWYHYHLGSGRTEEHKQRVNNPVWSHVSDGGATTDFATIVTRLCTGDVPNPRVAHRLKEKDIDVLTERYLATFKDGLTNGTITIGRTETMRDDFLAFLAAHEIEVPETLAAAIRERPKLNITKHAPYQEHYSPELRELVGHKARLIVERYGYEFGGVPEPSPAVD